VSEQTDWMKSSFSGSDGCWEVRMSEHGTMLVRDSKLGDDSPMMELTMEEWDWVLSDSKAVGQEAGYG